MYISNTQKSKLKANDNFNYIYIPRSKPSLSSHTSLSGMPSAAQGPWGGETTRSAERRPQQSQPSSWPERKSPLYSPRRCRRTRWPRSPSCESEYVLRVLTYFTAIRGTPTCSVFRASKYSWNIQVPQMQLFALVLLGLHLSGHQVAPVVLQTGEDRDVLQRLQCLDRVVAHRVSV